MLALIALAAAAQQSPFIPACPLPEEAQFYERLDALPTEILQDFSANAGRVVNPGDEVNLSDVISDPRIPTRFWRYVLQIKDDWFISYVSGGFVTQNITVAYTVLRPSGIRFKGAVSGDLCAAYDYLRGRSRFRVIEGWRRIDKLAAKAK